MRRAQNRAHKCFVFRTESGNLWIGGMEPGRSGFKFREIFYLDDVECRRNIRRQIDNSAFMKKARLHRMQPSPIHCPPRLFLTFLS